MTMKRSATALLVLTLVAAACGSDDEGSNDPAANSSPPVETETVPATEAPAATEAPTVTGASEDTDVGGATSIALASTDIGELLVDGDGNSLYLFVPDSAGDSTCYDDCEAAWPILGEVSDVGDGLDPALLGTTTRTNGDVQATYNGWPLYHFARDEAPGDVNGQGVGDVWYVLDAAGAAIGT